MPGTADGFHQGAGVDAVGAPEVGGTRSEGRLFETFDRTLRDGVTARNQATMTKLLALL